jgi:hypothetical protein
MAFLVNSAPGPGLRFQPSVTFADANSALAHAAALLRGGMREIKIRDIESGAVFGERGFRDHLKQLKEQSEASKAK